SLKGVVFNRVHEEFPADPETFAGGTVARADLQMIESAVLAAGITPETARWLARNFVDYPLLARGEAVRMEQFRRGLSRKVPLVGVPNFDSDLHDVAGLTRMHRFLFGDRAARDPAAEALAGVRREVAGGSSARPRRRGRRADGRTSG